MHAPRFRLHLRRLQVPGPSASAGVAGPRGGPGPRIDLLVLACCVSGALAGCVPEEAPPSTPADEPGPFPVATLETTFSNVHGTYAAIVHYPDSSAGAPYPAVTFSHGNCGFKGLYTWVGAHLASHGYVVLAYDNPGVGCNLLPGFQHLELDHEAHVDGLIDGLSHLADLGAGPGGPLAGQVDPDRTAVMGHSWGANTSFDAAAADATIDAVVPIAGTAIPTSTLEAISAPTLFLAGDLDCMVYPPDQPANYGENYERLPASTDRELITLSGANHGGFLLLDPFGLGTLVGDCERTIALDAHQHRLSRRYFTAWFEVFLKGRNEFETYLTGAQAHQDVDDGLFADFRYVIDGAEFESAAP